MFNTLKLFTLISMSFVSFTYANTLTLSSSDIVPNTMMSKKHEFAGFGCSGGNLSPHLAWKNVPAGTKSFAITVYDADAPTGSGWWHWQVINIPAFVREITTGAGSATKGNLPQGAKQIANDYGSKSFGGACPPAGHGVHNYQFTLHALSVEKLALPDNASGALAGYMINANAIASTSFKTQYKRD